MYKLTLVLIAFLLALVINLPAQEISDDIYDVLMNKDVVLVKKDATVLKGTLMKMKDNSIFISNTDGEIVKLLKSDVKSIKQTNKTIVQKEVQEDTRPVLSPEKAEKKENLLKLYRENLKSGKTQKVIAKLLYIPGIIIAGVGLLCVGSGYAIRPSSEYRQVSDYNYNYYTDKYEYTYTNVKNPEYDAATALIYTGWICTGIGVACTVAGIIVSSGAGDKLRQAEAYKKEAESISYMIIPQVDPVHNRYALGFRINF